MRWFRDRTPARAIVAAAVLAGGIITSAALAQTDLVQQAQAAYKAGRYAEAVALFTKAADQGNAEAQFTVGLMYSGGLGTRSDPTLGLAWMRKAADQGHATAQYFLARIYETGKLVPKDMAVAIEWYRKSAALGNEDAKQRLAELEGKSSARMETISLVCEEKTLGGKPSKGYIFVDPTAKYVKYQWPGITTEYKDGAYGKVFTTGTWVTGPQAALRQFVIVTDDIIRFGGKEKGRSVEIEIDRHTGLLTVNGGPPTQCFALHGF